MTPTHSPPAPTQPLRHSLDKRNTLLKGHKWWVLYPEGFRDDNDQLSCDPSCSVDTPLTLHWYAGVGINAARTEYPLEKYGRHVLQGPGETIYVPDGIVHSVFNMDEVVAITKNYASAANLVNVWKETVLDGDPLKWRMMYYHTLNSEQRRRVRNSRYWPPRKWERREERREKNSEELGEQNDQEEEECEPDEADSMTQYPMYGHETDWRPEIGDPVEVLFGANTSRENGKVSSLVPLLSPRSYLSRPLFLSRDF